MITEFLSETLVKKSLVVDSVINGARRERRRGMGTESTEISCGIGERIIQPKLDKPILQLDKITKSN